MIQQANMPQQLVILSGLSGSGKTTVLHTLEDASYYCVDNLPIAMLPTLCRELHDHHPARKVAVSIDIRNLSPDFSGFDEILKTIQTTTSYKISIVFLDASPEALIRRFNETRRRHPLQTADMNLMAAIEEERHRLDHIIQASTVHFDTSNDNVHALRDRIKQLFASENIQKGLLLRLQSFGFKHGAPTDSDFVFDARHLPNPHWEPSLRALTGKDPAIQQFLSTYPEVNDYRDDIATFFQRWISKLDDGRRHFLTIAIGCTGGKHRSVYLIESLATILSTTSNEISIHHRDCPIT